MTAARIDYIAREQFIAYHKRKERFAALVCHRRAGKTVACIADLIDETIRVGLIKQLQNPRTAYIAPLYKQAKDVAWSYACDMTRDIPGIKRNESELRIDFPDEFGGGRFRLYGADNPDSLRGIYLDATTLDEFADMRPRFLPEVIRPALSDRKGRLTLIGTPKGRNEFFDAFTAAQSDKNWYAALMRASETHLVDDEELTAARRMMSENQYAQEFECSFEAAIEGAYYGNLIEAASMEGRIGPVPYRADLPVYVGWDLGIGDDTSLWFVQRVGGFLHVIDHYATNGEAASHYIEVLNSKPYNYGRQFVPHDAESREWISGQRRIDVLRSLLPKQDWVVVNRAPVDDGINAVRSLMPTMRFDEEKCHDGIESLRQYRREYDENKRCFKPTPLHDWTSHDADALRYLCLGLEPEAAPVKIPRYSQQRRRAGGNALPSAWTA